MLASGKNHYSMISSLQTFQVLFLNYLVLLLKVSETVYVCVLLFLLLFFKLNFSSDCFLDHLLDRSGLSLN